MPGEQHVSAVRSRKVIVAAAIITEGRVLACERSAPPEVAGRWEFPGGKVEPGETDEQALARECVEELGVRVEIGARVGPDVSLAHGRAVPRVYAARRPSSTPRCAGCPRTSWTVCTGCPRTNPSWPNCRPCYE